VSEPQPSYELQVSASAARTIQLKLPEGVAAAVIEFITGSLLANPRRVGNELRNELSGVCSARRGAFRVLYEIDDQLRLVTVLRIEHRADVYRPR
jgi:mRNA-degrading endonuclease RelE of RelBE toxin-antitoxin system